MRSSLGDRTPVGGRRAWQAPALVDLPINSQTKFARANSQSVDAGSTANPEPPAAPSSKLGFSFEMSFPLSARTD